MRQNLLLIDGHNFLFKAFGVPFKYSSPKGTPLHVTTAFLSLVRRSVAALAPFGGCHFVTIVFDAQGPTANHALSADYKANRTYEYEDDSPFDHLPTINRALEYLRLPVIERPGTEADDIVATLATKFTAQGTRHHAFIASHDSDFYQLISPRIRQINLLPHGEHLVLNTKSVKTKTGVHPHQYVLYKSLMGDSCDNICGIAGVGPIRAARIVNKKMRIDLTPHQEMLELNQKLITLNRAVKLRPKWIRLNEKHLATRSSEVFRALGL